MIKNSIQCGLFCFRHFSQEILPQIVYFCSWPLFYLLIFLSALRIGVFRGFFCLCFPPLLPKYGSLIVWQLQFQEFSQLLPKGQLPWRTGKCQIWKRCPFPLEKTKIKCLLFTGKQHIFTCLNMLLGLHVSIVRCLAGRAAFCTVWSFEFICFICFNSQKSWGENTRA